LRHAQVVAASFTDDLWSMNNGCASWRCGTMAILEAGRTVRLTSLKQQLRA
jgi:hypothetical protein